MKQALNLETRMQGSIRPRAASRSVGASPFGSSRESRGMASSERESYLLKLDESTPPTTTTNTTTTTTTTNTSTACTTAATAANYYYYYYYYYNYYYYYYYYY